MKRFKKLFNESRRFKICFFEEKEQYWPNMDGWTQRIYNEMGCEDNDNEYFSINYLNDKKNFCVNFDIIKNSYSLNEFEGSWVMNEWGIEEGDILSSLNSIKYILKKCEILYDKAKLEGMKKIPIIYEWEKKVNDYEIVYSRKQNDRTVIVKIINIHNFIINRWFDYKVNIYNDSMNDRITDEEFYNDVNRKSFKNVMSNLNDKYFKK